MSTNHFPTELLEAPWWTQHQQQHMMEPPIKTSSREQNTFFISSPNNNNAMFCSQNPAFSINLNHEDDDEIDEQSTDDQREKEEEQEGQYQESQEIAKEALFEKPLTPSDVGKLNRLVIPKQYAEKYFPLSGNDSGTEKGLLLSFEDESGKLWRFRYSYWNSSQSYVLTKGWSRFVKEKRLDAGDVVLFERHRDDGDRLFIGWRRKGTPATQVQDGGGAVAQPATVTGGGGGGWTPVFYSGHPYPLHGAQLPYQPDYLHAGSVMQSQTASSGNSKRLRLFGVNLECQPDESEPSTPDGSSSSMSGLLQAPAHPHQLQQHHYHSNSHAYDHHTDTDINFSRDVNQKRYHHG